MSAYSSVKTKLKNRECLVAGLTEMGFQPVVSDAPLALTGYQGDKRQQTAEVVIPRAQVGGASNDIGFQRQPDGTFAAIISQFDSRQYDAAWLRTVQQQHDVANAIRIARRQGYSRPVVKQAGEDVQLVFNIA